MFSPISKLSDDCLELIFQSCGGCPWTLYTLTKVSRRWYSIANRSSVWRLLVINKPSLHRSYATFLSSESNVVRLQAVRTLVISKPTESRHAHLRPLPFEVLTHVTQVYTFNLCLAEIEYISQQLRYTELDVLICNHIETWCDTRKFSFDLIQSHPQLRHVQFQFMEDGHSGFASIHNPISNQDQKNAPLPIQSFCLTSTRDSECMQQRNLMIVMEEVENDRDEVYTQQDMDRLEHKQHVLLESWYELENSLLQKYQFLTRLHQLQHFEFGFCYGWTPTIWRSCFGQVVKSNPYLKSLSLHGWDQVGKLEKISSKSSTIEPIRADAESAIYECFEMLENLNCIQLVDFSVGSGLLQASKHIAQSIQHLEVVYSKSFARYLAEPDDIWLLMGPLKEFVVSTFSGDNMHTHRYVDLHLHPDLIKEVKNKPFFENEPLLTSIQTALKEDNVQVNLFEYSGTS